MLHIPKEGQPTSDFYNAAGTGVKLEATAKPTEIKRDEWLTFTLTITNLVNAPDVEKPSLKALESFNGFQVEEGKELDPKADPTIRDQRVIVYRLKPVSENVMRIPEITFYYFDPKRQVSPNRPQDRFPVTYSKQLAIRVLATTKADERAPEALEVPPFASQLTPRSQIFTQPPSNPPVFVWAIALVMPPLLALGWVLAWRKLFPGSAKLLLLKRNRAVRHALQSIAMTHRLPADEVADAVALLFVTYLHERFDLPPGAIAIGEIAAHLHSINCDPERIERVEAFLRNCDEQRFSPMSHPSATIANEAENLIITLEEPA